MFYVFPQTNGEIDFTKCLLSVSIRSDAVFWCMVNRVSPLPDGEWEDDYFILQTPCVAIHKSLGKVLINDDAIELQKRSNVDNTSIYVLHDDELKEVSLKMLKL